ncbi:hypothetical protein BDV59DRAFT_208048 [Aspergillus ambiguus]|uniref:Gly-Xaa carboxypeptidase n=1 Tax=Aspergillus ambiguus TaxID=176160 RepID=UPI003CCCB9DD
MYFQSALVISLGLLALPHTASFIIPSQTPLGTSTDAETCPLAAKVPPPNDGFTSGLKFVKDAHIRAQQVERLSRAVQVPTTVNDYLTDPYDPGFAPFLEFHSLLEQLFPLTHATAHLSHVNRLGLVYTLNGTSAAKPLLFTAHQDVVPIVNAADWTHPPFAGHFDGEWLWGRGASDCKNVLIGLLSVVEDLLAQGWTPTRTVVLAFGFDEESHGWLGAGSIAAYLEETFGADGDAFEFVLDEGGMGLEVLSSPSSSSSSSSPATTDVVYALPGVSEKGSLDLTLELRVAGGHSSVPPAHTGIGMMAEIIYTLERAELFRPRLDASHPAYRKLQCQVAHSPDAVEPWLARALAGGDDAETLAERLAVSRGAATRFTLQTSQAADLISGGVKSNALPETVSALVNYRVALHQTPDEVQARAVRLIAPIAERYNLTLVAFPEEEKEEEETGLRIPGDNDGHAANTLVLSTLSEPLRPAPVSPTDLESETWARFAGVTRAVFESVPSLQGKTVVVAGDIMTGNTDTRFYWNLSRNIYRWSPSRQGGALNIHTVDERVAIDVHLEAMMLYYDLIRAFDGAGQTEIEHDL